MRGLIIAAIALIAFGFGLGFLVGTSYVAEEPGCQAASERLSDVFDLSEDREVVKLPNGLWCRLK